jgi:hypothetical protein
LPKARSRWPEIGGGRDRDLGQAAGDREQNQAAELFAEAEADVERIGGLGEKHAGDPRRSAGSNEHDDEQRRVEPAHPSTIKEGAALRLPLGG